MSYPTNHFIEIWSKGNSASQRSISSSVLEPYSLFATVAGDLYISSESSDPRVDRWTSSTAASVLVMTMCDPCNDIFVDTDNNLFCSMKDQHQVVMRSFGQRPNTYAIVAGTSVCGSTSDRLCDPVGIFVTTEGDLYVADCGNDRVQLFRSGELNATSVAGKKARGTIALNCPTAVLLDGGGYLFIVDQGNDRIVGSGLDGFRCVAGCSNSIWGNGADELDTPWSMAFDSHGNIFVVDTDNNRIQKFLLATNVCSKWDHITPSIVSFEMQSISFWDCTSLQ